MRPVAAGKRETNESMAVFSPCRCARATDYCNFLSHRENAGLFDLSRSQGFKYRGALQSTCMNVHGPYALATVQAVRVSSIRGRLILIPTKVALAWGPAPHSFMRYSKRRLAMSLRPCSRKETRDVATFERPAIASPTSVHRVKPVRGRTTGAHVVKSHIAALVQWQRYSTI